LAGEPIKSSQANAGGEMLFARKAHGKSSSRSKTLYLSPARCGKKSSVSPPPLRAEGEKDSKNK